MEVLGKVVSLPHVPVTSLIGASLYAFSGFIRMPSYDETCWYLSRLLAVYGSLSFSLFLLSFPAKRHPLAVRDMVDKKLSFSFEQLLNYGKLSLLALACQHALPNEELPKLFSLLVIYLLISPLASYLLALVMSVIGGGKGRGVVEQFADVTPRADVELVFTLLNPAGRTFTGVPPEEQLYREFRPPRSEEKTSAVKRETSATKGSEGEGRCKVIDEGPHFNRTARGCLISG